MHCPSCHQEVEDGARYCGNCGLQINLDKSQPALDSTFPQYALANDQTHESELKSLVSLLIAVGGLIGAIFMALVGLSLGLVALITATVTRSYHHRLLNTSAIVIACLAILTSLSVWGLAIASDRGPARVAGQAAQTAYEASLTTPCYSIGFTNKFNVSTAKGSCNAVIYNGSSFSRSSDAYKIFSNQANIINSSQFLNLAKKAVDQDLATNLTTFQVDNRNSGSFAGSPAYIAHVYNQIEDVAVAEGAVYHPSASGPNVFILVHAVNGRSTDFKVLEAQWQWE